MSRVVALIGGHVVWVILRWVEIDFKGDIAKGLGGVTRWIDDGVKNKVACILRCD